MSVSTPKTSAHSPDKTPVAGDVFTYCTREKRDTWHVVRNHNAAGIVDRVVCKACGSEHKYKSKAAAAAAPSSTRTLVRRPGMPLAAPTKAPTSASRSLEDEWFASVKKWGDKPVATFSPETHFSAGEVFQHPTFGKGVVQSRRENKIDVLFASGILKTLISK